MAYQESQAVSGQHKKEDVPEPIKITQELADELDERACQINYTQARMELGILPVSASIVIV